MRYFGRYLAGVSHNQYRTHVPQKYRTHRMQCSSSSAPKPGSVGKPTAQIGSVLMKFVNQTLIGSPLLKATVIVIGFTL